MPRARLHLTARPPKRPSQVIPSRVALPSANMAYGGASMRGAERLAAVLTAALVLLGSLACGDVSPGETGEAPAQSPSPPSALQQAEDYFAAMAELEQRKTELTTRASRVLASASSSSAEDWTSLARSFDQLESQLEAVAVRCAVIEPPDEVKTPHGQLVRAVRGWSRGCGLLAERLRSDEPWDAELWHKALDPIRRGNALEEEWSFAMKVCAERHGLRLPWDRETVSPCPLPQIPPTVAL